jgi:hypothetical protein
MVKVHVERLWIESSVREIKMENTFLIPFQLLPRISEVTGIVTAAVTAHPSQQL